MVFLALTFLLFLLLYIASPVKFAWDFGARPNATPVKTEPVSEKGGKYPDKAYLHIIENDLLGGCTGIAVVFKEDDDKPEKKGPFTANVMYNILKKTQSFVGGKLTIIKKGFPFLIDGDHFYPGGGKWALLCYVAWNIDTKIIASDVAAKALLKEIVKDIKQHYRGFYNKKATTLVTIPDDCIVRHARWDEIMKSETILDIIKFNHSVELRDPTIWPAKHEITWAMRNMDLINSCFQRGTMTKYAARFLGLTEDWADPDNKEVIDIKDSDEE